MKGQQQQQQLQHFESKKEVTTLPKGSCLSHSFFPVVEERRHLVLEESLNFRRTNTYTLVRSYYYYYSFLSASSRAYYCYYEREKKERSRRNSFPIVIRSDERTSANFDQQIEHGTTPAEARVRPRQTSCHGKSQGPPQVKHVKEEEYLERNGSTFLLSPSESKPKPER